jgi:hypothetical protein
VVLHWLGEAFQVQRGRAGGRMIARRFFIIFFLTHTHTHTHTHSPTVTPTHPHTHRSFFFLCCSVVRRTFSEGTGRSVACRCDFVLFLHTHTHPHTLRHMCLPPLRNPALPLCLSDSDFPQYVSFVLIAVWVATRAGNESNDSGLGFRV